MARPRGHGRRALHGGAVDGRRPGLEGPLSETVRGRGAAGDVRRGDEHRSLCALSPAGGVTGLKTSPASTDDSKAVDWAKTAGADMKGIIFNLVEEVVSSAHGSAAWDRILDAAGLDGAYTSLGSYPDDDLMRLVAAASEALGVAADAVVRQIGQGALPLLAERFSDFFDGH